MNDPHDSVHDKEGAQQFMAGWLVVPVYVHYLSSVFPAPTTSTEGGGEKSHSSWTEHHRKGNVFDVQEEN